jgi:hypothetical protein
MYNEDYNPYNNDDTYDVAPSSSSPAPVEDNAGADQNVPAQQASPDINTSAGSGEN